MMIIRRVIFIILFLHSASFALAQEIVVKVFSGQEYRGRVIKKDNKQLTLKSSGGNYYIPVDDIDTIDGQHFDVKIGDVSNQVKAVELKPVLQNSLAVAQALSPQQIFEKTADAVVVIHAYLDDGASQGSGFVVNPNGIIVTNFHVIDGANSIDVQFKDGRKYWVTQVLNSKLFRDIAVLKIEAQGLPTVTLGDSNNLTPGQSAYVIGAPLGLDYSITNGLFSGYRKSEMNYFYYIDLQISAPISPGNSGGPLFDGLGKVIGITTSYLLDGQNLNFAIPISYIRPLIQPPFNSKSMEAFASTTRHSAQLALQVSHNMTKSDFKTLEAYAQDSLSSDASMTDAILMASELYYTNGNGEKAEELIQQAIRINPGDSELYYQLGLISYSSGKMEKSLDAFKKAIELRPDYSDAYFSIAGIYEKMDKLNVALENIQKAISFPPKMAVYYNSLGWIYHRLNKNNEAIEALKLAIDIDPKDYRSYLSLVGVYLDTGNMDLARQYAQQYIDFGQSLPEDMAAKLGMKTSLDPVQMFEEAGKFYNDKNYEQCYRLQSKALRFYSGSEQGQFAARMITLKTLVMLMNEKIKLNEENVAIQLAKESIKIVEDYGGVDKLINLSKKYSGVAGLFPNQDDLNAITLGYFLMASTSSMSDKNSALVYYNVIKGRNSEIDKSFRRVMKEKGW